MPVIDFHRLKALFPHLFETMLAALVVAIGWNWISQPDSRQQLRQADALFAAGRYHDALQAYRALPEPATTHVLVREGMIETIRGEGIPAGRTIAQAIAANVQGTDYELARLYQGRASALKGQPEEALGFWRMIEPHSPFLPYRHVLEAETLLQVGQYSAAEAAYRTAIDLGLADSWRDLALARIAALRATSDINGAKTALAARGQSTRIIPPDLIGPLQPNNPINTTQLRIALDAAPEQRAQLLGQLYLDAGLYALAEAQFAAVASDLPYALSARAYAAYARLRAGDRQEGIQRLEAIVRDHPDNTNARALLALAYLDQTDQAQAKAQLDRVRALAPRSPDTHMAWGQWYAAQHEYFAAADEYRRALSEADVEQRGSYLLALARFNLDTTIQICESGRPAAEEATRLEPDNAQAWTTLAEAQLACGNPSGAAQAANAALQRSPDNAEASLYLGQALAQQGQRTAARAALVAAADMAPASNWRARAEREIAEQGL